MVTQLFKNFFFVVLAFFMECKFCLTDDVLTEIFKVGHCNAVLSSMK